MRALEHEAKTGIDLAAVGCDQPLFRDVMDAHGIA
jgi:hypothetical protein